MGGRRRGSEDDGNPTNTHIEATAIRGLRPQVLIEETRHVGSRGEREEEDEQGIRRKPSRARLEEEKGQRAE